jgi:hypothetical protein
MSHDLLLLPRSFPEILPSHPLPHATNRRPKQRIEDSFMD